MDRRSRRRPCIRRATARLDPPGRCAAERGATDDAAAGNAQDGRRGQPSRDADHHSGPAPAALGEPPRDPSPASATTTKRRPASRRTRRWSGRAPGGSAGRPGRRRDADADEPAARSRSTRSASSANEVVGVQPCRARLRPPPGRRSRSPAASGGRPAAGAVPRRTDLRRGTPAAVDRSTPGVHRRLRPVLGTRMGGARVPVHVGLRQPGSDVAQVAVGEDRIARPPEQQHRHPGQRRGRPPLRRASPGSDDPASRGMSATKSPIARRRSGGGVRRPRPARTALGQRRSGQRGGGRGRTPGC